jgi:hypothetical protein
VTDAIEKPRAYRINIESQQRHRHTDFKYRGSAEMWAAILRMRYGSIASVCVTPVYPDHDSQPQYRGRR